MVKRDLNAIIERLQRELRIQRDPTQPLAERVRTPGQLTIPFDADAEAKRLGHRGKHLAGALSRELAGYMNAARPPRSHPPPGGYHPTPPPDPSGIYYVNTPVHVEQGGGGCTRSDPNIFGFIGEESGPGGGSLVQPPNGDGGACWYSWDPPDVGTVLISASISMFGNVTLIARDHLTYKLMVGVNAYQVDPITGAHQDHGSSQETLIDIDSSNLSTMISYVDDTYFPAPLLLGVTPATPLIIRVAAWMSVDLGSSDDMASWSFCPTVNPVAINFNTLAPVG